MNLVPRWLRFRRSKTQKYLHQVISKSDNLSYLHKNQEFLLEKKTALSKKDTHKYRDLVFAQIKAIRHLQESEEIEFQLIGELKEILQTHLNQDQAEVQEEEQLMGKLSSKVQNEWDQEAMGIYKNMFYITLQEDKIAKDEYGNEEKAYETGQVEENILRDLKRCLEKQKSIVNQPSITMDDIQKCENLLIEEEKFYSILMHDEQVIKSLEKTVQEDIAKSELDKERKKRIRWALIRLASKGSVLAVIVVLLIKMFETGPTRSEIMASVEQYLNKPVGQLIQELPDDVKNEIQNDLEKIAKQHWSNEHKKILAQAKKKYADEIYQVFITEYNRNKSVVQNTFGFTPKPKFDKDEIYEAIEKTLNFHRVDIIQLKDLSIGDKIYYYGWPTPQYTRKLEGKIALEISNHMEPIIRDIKDTVKERIGWLFTPDFIEQYVNKEFKESHERVIKDWHIILGVIFGYITLSTLIDKIPLMKPARKKFTKGMTTGVWKDIAILIKNQKR